MSKDQIFGVLRHVLTFGGGFLVAQGWLDGAALDQGIAAILTLGGLVWSFVDKRQTT